MTATSPWPPVQVDVVARGGIPQWRPWKALTQAEYNALQASGEWDPNTLYVITPQRVMHGGTEVWPGPWDGGIESYTPGGAVTVNPTQVIPTTKPGNLLVACIARYAVLTGAAVTAVSDSAGQTWKEVLPRGGFAGQYTQTAMWYLENSASIDQVRFTGTALSTLWWIFEVAGIATADALDTNNAMGTNAATLSQSISLQVAAPSLVFTAITASASLGPQFTSRPAGWENFDDQPHFGSTIQRASAAMRRVEGGQTADATWGTSPVSASYGAIIAAFRTVTADVP